MNQKHQIAKHHIVKHRIVVRYIHHVDAAGIVRKIECEPVRFAGLRQTGIHQTRELIHRGMALLHLIRSRFETLAASDEVSSFAAALADLRPYLGVLRMTAEEASVYPASVSLLDSLGAADRREQRQRRAS